MSELNLMLNPAAHAGTVGGALFRVGNIVEPFAEGISEDGLDADQIAKCRFNMADAFSFYLEDAQEALNALGISELGADAPDVSGALKTEITTDHVAAMNAYVQAAARAVKENFSPFFHQVGIMGYDAAREYVQREGFVWSNEMDTDGCEITRLPEMGLVNEEVFSGFFHSVMEYAEKKENWMVAGGDIRTPWLIDQMITFLGDPQSFPPKGRAVLPILMARLGFNMSGIGGFLVVMNEGGDRDRETAEGIIKPVMGWPLGNYVLRDRLTNRGDYLPLDTVNCLRSMGLVAIDAAMAVASPASRFGGSDDPDDLEVNTVDRLAEVGGRLELTDAGRNMSGSVERLQLIGSELFSNPSLEHMVASLPEQVVAFDAYISDRAGSDRLMIDRANGLLHRLGIPLPLDQLSLRPKVVPTLLSGIQMRLGALIMMDWVKSDSPILSAEDVEILWRRGLVSNDTWGSIYVNDQWDFETALPNLLR